jgi:hypothetical protein
MARKQNKKNTPLFPGGRMATQEDCNRINNGGATQIVLNRRVKSSRGNKSNPTSSEGNEND